MLRSSTNPRFPVQETAVVRQPVWRIHRQWIVRNFQAATGADKPALARRRVSHPYLFSNGRPLLVQMTLDKIELEQ